MEISKLEKIILPSRDGAKLWLVQISPENSLYTLVCDSNHTYILNYATITLMDDNISIYSFDPSGGPFLCVGYKIDESREIKAIIPLDDNIVFMIR